ncbi:MAG TPA: coenzyme F420-0:L-glutamate ligase [Terriglobia bacterium]|nr:coenzyme F420-0:L-glutamate ligase [Terriglobia bacterium]
MNLQIVPIGHVPEIAAGMDLGECLREGVKASGWELEERDILAVTQKVISKAEGRVVRLGSVEPSARSVSMGRQTGKDPRLIEVILRESRRILRIRGPILICETHHGFICANAGVDQSNVDGSDSVTLLPKDPDGSARELARILGCGIIVTDTFGRVWREGLVDTAVGIARVPAFIDFRGKTDTQGRPLQATLLASVDALAAAAGLVMGKTARTPAALIRGFPWEETNSSMAPLLRAPESDLFL